MAQPGQALQPDEESAAVTLVHEILKWSGLDSTHVAPLLKELLLLVAPDHPGSRQIDDDDYRSHLSHRYETAQEALKTAWLYSDEHDRLFEAWLGKDVEY